MTKHAVVPRGELFDALEDAAVIGDVTPGHVIFDRQRIDLAPQQRMRQQPLELRSEGQAAVAQRRHVKRLHPEPIAREEQLALAAIVYREGEHAVETA